MEKKEYKISEEFVGLRLDKAISQKDDSISRASVQRMIDEGNILINGNKTKTSYKLKLDDIVTIIKEEPKEVEIKAEDIPLDVIYEDKDLIAFHREMIRIHKDYDATIIFVTHDLQEAFSLADRIAVLTNGKVEEIGTPRELRITAKSELLRGYLGL